MAYTIRLIRGGHSNKKTTRKWTAVRKNVSLCISLVYILVGFFDTSIPSNYKKGTRIIHAIAKNAAHKIGVTL